MRTLSIIDKKRKRALSLLEIMISFTLFVTTMVLLMSLWVSHARAIELGQDQDVAVNLAQTLMEQALSMNFADPAVFSPPPTNIARQVRGVVYNSTFWCNATCFDNTTFVAFPMPPALKDIRVEVLWHDATGNHTVHMESYANW